MLHNTGFQFVLAYLFEQLDYIGVGNSATPMVKSDALLKSEVYRKAVSESLIDGMVLVKEIFLDESEANGAIKELGIFCDGATGAVNSGKLFSSGVTDLTKDSTQSLTVSFETEVFEGA